jgi:lactoylglutathione lyase
VGGALGQGWPKHVLLRGRQIVSDGTYQGTPGAGQWLHRAAIGTDPAHITGTADMTRPDTPNILAITFLYYKDLARAEAFYRDVMGFPLVIDQGGLAKIMKICDGAHVGLVDEAHGMHKWAETRPVQLCVRVGDVDAWYAYAKAQDLPTSRKLFVNDAIGIRAFVFDDPEGYQVEIQEATRRRMTHEHALRHQPQLDANRHRRHRRSHRPLRPMAAGSAWTSPA